MRALITGAAGFVGPYVVEALRTECRTNLDIIATSKNSNRQSERILPLDVLDVEAVRSCIARYRPSHVIHLAAMAAPRDARSDPENAWRLHVIGTLNVANAILDLVPECWLIHVSSGLVYGETAKLSLPLDESALLAPIDDYAVTKAAADLAIGAEAHKGLKTLRMRPFNHTGPGQTDAFVVPAFASQVACIELGMAPPIIKVGNLDTERDFLDVRDVTKAYAMCACNIDEIESNTIFNVASGIPRRTGDILEWFLSHSHVKITVEHDPEKFRGNDLMRIVGTAELLRETLGWSPKYSFEDTLGEVLITCRKKLALQQRM